MQVNDRFVGEVEITEGEDVVVDEATSTPGDGTDGIDGERDEPTDGESTTTESSESDDGGFLDRLGPGLGPVTALLAVLLGGLLFLWRRSESE